jgi:hypothetical protein
LSVIGRIGAERAAPPKLSDGVRALLGAWLKAGHITQPETVPSATEQAFALVLDAYQRETDARIEALEKRNEIITRT